MCRCLSSRHGRLSPASAFLAFVGKLTLTGFLGLHVQVLPKPAAVHSPVDSISFLTSYILFEFHLQCFPISFSFFTVSFVGWVVLLPRKWIILSIPIKCPLSSINERQMGIDYLHCCLHILLMPSTLRPITKRLREKWHDLLLYNSLLNLMTAALLWLPDYGPWCCRTAVISQCVITDVQEVGHMQSNNYLHCDVLIFSI